MDPLETFAKKKEQLDALLVELAELSRLKKVKIPARAWSAKMEADYKSLQTKTGKLEDEVSKMHRELGSVAAAVKADKEDAAAGPARSTGPLGPTPPGQSAFFKRLVAGSTRKRRTRRRRRARTLRKKSRV